MKFAFRCSIVPLLGLLSVILAGCGGGGGGGSSAPSEVATGQVTVLLADGPADEFDKIVITIHRVSLLPAGGGEHVVLFRSNRGIEVDLLDLRDEDYILAVRHAVAAGSYSKLRLHVSDVQSDGGPCDHLEIKLPSGKIDLTPRGTFEVIPGGSLAIRLDIDANKSINLHEAGNSGKCIFRPVAFVDIETLEPPSRCPRSVAGTLTELLGAEDDPGGFLMDLDSDRGEIEVRLSDGTTIFDEEGIPIAAADLGTGQHVRVRGRLDDRGRLRAAVVVVGQVIIVSGVAEGPVVDGRFELALSAGEGIVGTVVVEILDDTAIVSGCDEPVRPGEIRRGTQVRVAGKLLADDGVLLGLFVQLRESTDGDFLLLSQTSTGMDLTIRAGETRESFAVSLSDHTRVLLGGRTEIGLPLLEALIQCSDIGGRVLLDPHSHRWASEVRVEPEEQTFEVLRIEGLDRIVTSEGVVLGLLPDAAILDVSGDRNRVLALDDIGPGDRIRVFGLRSCPAGDEPPDVGSPSTANRVISAVLVEPLEQ